MKFSGVARECIKAGRKTRFYGTYFKLGTQWVPVGAGGGPPFLKAYVSTCFSTAKQCSFLHVYPVVCTGYIFVVVVHDLTPV